MVRKFVIGAMVYGWYTLFFAEEGAAFRKYYFENFTIASALDSLNSEKAAFAWNAAYEAKVVHIFALAAVLKLAAWVLKRRMQAREGAEDRAADAPAKKSGAAPSKAKKKKPS